MTLSQAMSLLRRQLPELDARSAETSFLCGRASQRPIDVYDFSVFISEHRADEARLRSLFDLLETFFLARTPDLRNWATSFLEALQNVAAWRSGSAGLMRFLGREARAHWNRIESIRKETFELDLDGCSVFEAEIVTWRFAREKARNLAAA